MLPLARYVQTAVVGNSREQPSRGQGCFEQGWRGPFPGHNQPSLPGQACPGNCSKFLPSCAHTPGPVPSDTSGSRGRGVERHPPPTPAPACRPTHAQWSWPRRRGQTHDPILHAEAQLVLEVRPLDEDRGDRRTADDVQPHLRLVLQTLQDGQASQGASRPPVGTLSAAQTEAESASRAGALGQGNESGGSATSRPPRTSVQPVCRVAGYRGWQRGPSDPGDTTLFVKPEARPCAPQRMTNGTAPGSSSEGHRRGPPHAGGRRSTFCLEGSWRSLPQNKTC